MTQKNTVNKKLFLWKIQKKVSGLDKNSLGKRLTFVKSNHFKADLNPIVYRLRSVSNFIAKKWLDLSTEAFKTRNNELELSK